MAPFAGGYSVLDAWNILALCFDLGTRFKICYISQVVFQYQIHYSNIQLQLSGISISAPGPLTTLYIHIPSP